MTDAKTIIIEITKVLGLGAEELGPLVPEADPAEMEQAAMEALDDVFYTAPLNTGQQELVDGYVHPAMEAAISDDPEDFTAEELIDEGITSHWAAEQALSITITEAATKAQRARDQVKREAELKPDEEDED
jgi:hypothetical protein